MPYLYLLFMSFHFQIKKLFVSNKASSFEVRIVELFDFLDFVIVATRCHSCPETLTHSEQS